MKDLMAVVAGVFGRRYTQKQKTSFMNYIGTRAQELGDKAVADGLDQSGASACRNIYLGSLNHADFILTAPYDTPARTLFSGVGYYPLSPRKNMTWDSLSLVLSALLGTALVVIYVLFVLRRFLSIGGTPMWLALAGMLAVSAAAFKLAAGTANRRNFSRNSASVVAALEYRKRYGKKVAVALLDRSCCSYAGYRQLAERLGGLAQSKKIVALDCIASGPEVHVHCGRLVGELLEKAPWDDMNQLHILDGEPLERTILKLFPKGLLITGGSWKTGETVILNTRSGRDCEIDLDKLDRTIEMLRDISERLK